MGRAPCCEKIGLKKGRWTTEEDEILKNYIQTHGEGSWRSLPKNAGLLRCGKSCRLRWINYLRSDLRRGNITPEEEDVIVKLHTTMGNRWSMIAGHLPGRTDNEIKNYWNSHLSRKIHYFKKPIINPYTTSNQTTRENISTRTHEAPPKRRGCGRTSRAAMKKKKESFTIHKKNKMANCSNIVTSGTESGTEMLDELLVGPDIMTCFNDVMQSGSNAGESSGFGSATSSDRLEWEWEWDPEIDYDQLWMGMEQDGSTGSEKQEIISLLWESTLKSAEEPVEDSAEAIVAWLMS